MHHVLMRGSWTTHHKAYFEHHGAAFSYSSCCYDCCCAGTWHLEMIEDLLRLLLQMLSRALQDNKECCACMTRTSSPREVWQSVPGGWGEQRHASTKPPAKQGPVAASQLRLGCIPRETTHKLRSGAFCHGQKVGHGCRP